MDRYLVKKLGDVETVSLEDSDYIVDADDLVNRLRTLKIYLDMFDFQGALKILTGG